MKLTEELLKSLIKEELSKTIDENYRKARAIAKEEGVEYWKTINFGKNGGAFKEGLQVLTNLGFMNVHGKVVDELNRINGSYTIYVNPEKIGAAEEALKKNAPGILDHMTITEQTKRGK